ncbi:type I restriction-modification enzyme R subunit C-terminal domain-containing protein [Sodalis ligni]|uniref:type I restriction-modification enzyme R subunit C-terminal domain-containing protein n=1 Tax=Sodalis ligni TaxID=2697027 RepID=UPI003C7E0972
MTEFFRFWNTAKCKQAMLEKLTEHRGSFSTYSKIVAKGCMLAVFELVYHIVFAQQPFTCCGRTNNVKKRDVFGK